MSRNLDAALKYAVHPYTPMSGIMPTDLAQHMLDLRAACRVAIARCPMCWGSGHYLDPSTVECDYCLPLRAVLAWEWPAPTQDAWKRPPVGQEARPLVELPCRYCGAFATAQERQECTQRKEAGA